MIFDGANNSITGSGGTLTDTGGELIVYTAVSGTIGTNISGASGGPFITFFGPGTLTLTGSSIANSNGSGNGISSTVASDRNVLTPIVSAAGLTVNSGGTFTSGLTNVFNGTTGFGVTVNTLGTLDLNGFNTTVSNLNGGSSALILGGTITNTSATPATLTLNNATATTTVPSPRTLA